MRPLILLTPLVVGCLLLATGCAKLRSWRKTDSPAPECACCVGKPAPELSAVDFDGKPVKLSDYRGKVVVVVFWASWCGPCLKMIPHEKELATRFHDRPFAMIGVNNDSEPERARS